MDRVATGLLLVSGALSVACWIALWRGSDRLVSKLAWTVVSAIPVLGPLLYAGMHHAPDVQPEVDQAPARGDWDVPPRDG
jgi:hypothetical protein